MNHLTETDVSLEDRRENVKEELKIICNQHEHSKQHKKMYDVCKVKLDKSLAEGKYFKDANADLKDENKFLRNTIETK